MTLEIRPLTEPGLKRAINVLDQEYGENGPDPCDRDSFDAYQKWLPASVSDDDASKELFAAYNIEYLKYWVGWSQVGNGAELVAVTGIFTEVSGSDTAWLGWSNVLQPDDDFGCKWLDTEDAMIRFSESVARSLGKDRLAIYVNEGEDCESMSRLIQRHGFKWRATRVDPKKWENGRASVYSKDLGIDI